MRLRLASAAAAVLLAPVSLGAQVLNRPERAADVVARNEDPTHSSQSLAVSVNLLGGYDQNDAGHFTVTDPDAPPVLTDSTSTGSIDAGLQYTHASGTRVFDVNLTGSGTYYGNSAISAGPTRALGAGVSFATPMGSSSRFNAEQRVYYNSLYSIGAFDQVALDAPIGEVPSGGPTQGVSEFGSFSSDTNLGFSQRLGRRATIDGAYGFVRQSFNGGASGDTNNHRATVGFARRMNRNTSLTATYAYANGEYAPLVGGGGTRPLIGQSISGGFDYTKRLSPRRAVQFNFGFGATRAEAVTGTSTDTPYAFWTPSGQVAARIDLGRTWALAANYNRGTTALGGLTYEAYGAGAFGATLGGTVGPVSLTFNGGYAQGATAAGAQVVSHYTTTTAAAQAGMPLGKHMNITVLYTWYGYELTGDALLPSSVPPDYSRNAIRAGLTVRFPIIETRTR